MTKITLQLTRPKFHFTPYSNWTNDPNGLVYYQGEYHLFYQHHPDSKLWGPMHWGHAVSKDLLHWDHLPIALAPDELGKIYSGSAVIDKNNSSKLFKSGAGIVAIYTNNYDTEVEGEFIQTQSIAYSEDQGRTWIKYEGNPVIENPGIKDFRDPKVLWHEQTERWIMILAVKDKIFIYSSENLINWEQESQFSSTNIEKGIWECPDLFELEVDNEEQSCWILKVDIVTSQRESNTYYFVGEFDGQEFKEYRLDFPQKIDYGRDFYAAQTWSNHPQGEKVWLGWMSDWTYAKKIPAGEWRNAMTLPRKLSLIKEDEKFSLIQTPIDNYLEKRECLLEENDVAINLNSKKEYQFNEFTEIELFSPRVNNFRINISNSFGERVIVEYNKSENSLILDRSQSGVCDFEESFTDENKVILEDKLEDIKLNIIKDKYSIEIFINDGREVMTSIVFPKEEYNRVAISSEEEFKMKTLKFYHLNL